MTKISHMKSDGAAPMDNGVTSREERSEKVADQPIQQDLKEQRLAVSQTCDPSVQHRNQCRRQLYHGHMDSSFAGFFNLFFIIAHISSIPASTPARTLTATGVTLTCPPSEEKRL